MFELQVHLPTLPSYVILWLAEYATLSLMNLYWTKVWFWFHFIQHNNDFRIYEHLIKEKLFFCYTMCSIPDVHRIPSHVEPSVFAPSLNYCHYISLQVSAWFQHQFQHSFAAFQNLPSIHQWIDIGHVVCQPWKWNKKQGICSSY